jgi:hypothetical protein
MMTAEQDYDTDAIVRVRAEPCNVVIDGQTFTCRVVNDFWSVTVALFALHDDALRFVWDHNKRYTGDNRV